jgi:hypothetical protein
MSKQTREQHYAAGAGDCWLQSKQMADRIEQLTDERALLHEVAGAAYEFLAGETPHPYTGIDSTLEKREERLRRALTNAGYPMVFG